MTTLLVLALSNVAVALVLAMVAWAAGRWLRRPALTHGLWLLVFLKLITPPLFAIPVIRTSAPAAAPVVQAALPAAVVQQAPAPIMELALAALPVKVVQPPPVEVPQPNVVVEPARQPAPMAAVVPAPPAVPVQVAAEPAPVAPRSAAEPLDWSWLPTALGWTWLTGAGCWFGLAGWRLFRFQRLLRLAQPATVDLRELAQEVAERMQVRCPRLVLVSGALSPMLWVFGRTPRLVLPASLVQRLTPEQWRTLLAHELAHWRRRDHWVRWLELVTLGLYWWCPLVWWAKRQLQQAEEECCDAWVVTTLPGAARAYALALVETVDFLSGARAVLPPSASGLGHVHLLKRRVTMILRGTTPRALTLTGLLAVVTLGMLLLPFVPTWAQDAQPAQPADPAVQKDDDKIDKTDADKARQEFQKVQQEFFELQQQINQKRRDLEEKLNKEFGEKQRDLAKRMQEALKKSGLGVPGGIGLVPILPGNPGQLGLPPPGGNLVPLIPLPGQPGQPGLAPPLPGLGAFPGQRPDLERRLDDMERKLDTLIRELRGGKGPNDAPRRPGGAPGTPRNVDRNPAPDAAPPSPRKE